MVTRWPITQRGEENHGNLQSAWDGNCAKPDNASASKVGAKHISRIRVRATFAVLHFASTTGIAVGNPVFDITTPAVIPAGATVLSLTATTVTISANVTGAGVAVGDSISFVSGHVKRATFANNVTSGNFDLTGATFAVLGNTTISAEANINTQPDFGIPDSDIQFAVNSLWNLLAGA
jgi:hypothetical protein